MLIFLHGEEGFLVNRRRRELQKSFSQKYPDAEIFTFDFEDQGTLDDVRRAVSACESGLFAARKLVIFLHPFELGETAQKPLLDFLQNFSGTDARDITLLLVQPDKVNKAHSLTRFLAKHADQTEVFPKLQPQDVANFIRRELGAIDKQTQFSPRALRLFSDSVGTEVARIVMELQKLAAFKPGGTLETEDVVLLCGVAAEENIFAALDALTSGDKPRALILLRRSAEKDKGGVYQILSMCAWQVRRLLLAREAFEEGIQSAAGLAAKTKLPPFAAQKILSALKNLPLARIKRGLLMLSDFDASIKQGKLDPYVALHLFVWKF